MFWLRLLRRLVVAAVAVCLLTVGVTAGRVWWTARSDDRGPADAIVVLGASQLDGRPSAVLAARLAHAQTLYQQGAAPRVITVGGSAPGDRFTEADSGRRWLIERGIPATDVIAVPNGRNTLDSMIGVAGRMRVGGWSSAVLVTDPWHSLRSRTMARDQGIDAVTSPTRSGPSVQKRSTEARYILRETAASLVYLVTHQAWERATQALSDQ